jgi:tetratricopeptide (TPR) repeat protein
MCIGETIMDRWDDREKAWDDEEKAWDDQEKALELYNDGVDFCEQEKFVEALACFNASILLNPEEEDTWCFKGVILFGQEKFQESITCFDEAIRI